MNSITEARERGQPGCAPPGSPDVEALASASAVLLVNKRSSPVVVAVNQTRVTLGGYEVRLVDM